jgi:hypothetical protein
MTDCRQLENSQPANPSLRGSEAIQGAGQILDRFAASAVALARQRKLARSDELFFSVIPGRCASNPE